MTDNNFTPTNDNFSSPLSNNKEEKEEEEEEAKEEFGEKLLSLFSSLNIATQETTYSARLVVDAIKSCQTEFPDVKSIIQLGVPVIFYNTAVYLTFVDTPFLMSIQTNPTVTGPSFAETALKINGKFVEQEDLGYGEQVIRHMNPSKLILHLREMFKTLPTYSLASLKCSSTYTEKPNQENQI